MVYSDDISTIILWPLCFESKPLTAFSASICNALTNRLILKQIKLFRAELRVAGNDFAANSGVLNLKANSLSLANLNTKLGNLRGIRQEDFLKALVRGRE